MAKHGGNQGGRPKGRKNDRTLSKEAARDALRQIVLERMREMTEAQIANAMGVSYFVAREKKTGKFVEIDQAEAKRMIRGEESDYQLLDIWEKQPSVQAYTDLMNRALDKPKEQAQEHEHKGEFRMIHELADR